MKNKLYLIVSMIIISSICTVKVCYSQIYENDLPLEDVIKYSEILEKINNYAIPLLCNPDLYTESQGWNKKMELMAQDYASYRLFKEDSTIYFSGLQEFYSAKKNIVKYLFQFRNSKSKCYWALGWYNRKYILNSKLNPNNQVYLSNKNIAAFILISNYILNSDKRTIRLYISNDKYSINDLYDKLEKFINTYYNSDKGILNDKMRLVFKDEFYNEFLAEEDENEQREQYGK